MQKIEENKKWERLEISSRKLEYQRKISCEDGLNKGQKWYGPNRGRSDLEEVARIRRRTIIKKGLNEQGNHNDVVIHL